MSTMSIDLPSGVAGLSEAEAAEFHALSNVWASKLERNRLRMEYYDGKNPLKDLGLSIPPKLQNTNTVVAWPAKAVDILAERSMFDGFVCSGDEGDEDDPLGLRPVLEANNFAEMYEQAVRSELIHSTVFWTVTLGDVAAGEPEVLISMRDAQFAAGLWDFRRHRLRSAMAVVDVTPDEQHQPTEIVLYLSDFVIVCSRGQGSGWSVSQRIPNPLGRPPVVAMSYRPDHNRPFGRSRITREVMSITDSGQRGALRGEILMEANTAPKMALIGGDPDAWADDQWRAYMNTILAITKDEDGELPEFKQFPQLTPQGAISYMQHLATRFAGATGVPVSSLGVVQDNPASAEAIYAAKDDLVTAAQSLNRGNQSAVTSVAQLVVAVRDGLALGDLPEAASALQARFRNPAMPSVVSQSDAMVKQISAIPWLAETEVALEELGYNESQILRLMEAKRRAEGRKLVDSLLSRGDGERVRDVVADPNPAMVSDGAGI